jgi:hypothetical protein
MTQTLAVPVESLPVRVVTVDAGKSDGLVFLHASSSRHFGPETLGERLGATGARFVPFEAAGGVELVNLDHVAYVEAPGNLPEIAELDAMESFRANVVFELTHGERLSGVLRYRRPTTSCRVSDLLNSADDEFLLLTAGDSCFYVNRRAVVRVLAEGP